VEDVDRSTPSMGVRVLAFPCMIAERMLSPAVKANQAKTSRM
jgi:hypothetical protein